MTDIRLFRTSAGSASKLEASSVGLEKALQVLVEKHLETFLGVSFLASEYSTGKKHAGRIDTLGLDENGCPVIIEYKRSLNENVINQGLFYLDWLLDHQGEFELLVLRTLGAERAKAIEWTAPRLLCIAGDFTRYDEHAVQQMNRNIELIRYRRYTDELLLLELVNASTAASDAQHASTPPGPLQPITASTDRITAAQAIDRLDEERRAVYEQLRTFLLGLGDDVQERLLKQYVAFRTLRNVATVVIRSRTLEVYLPLDPTTISLEEGFTRDVREIGHHGTGSLEVSISNSDALERAKPLLLRSYEDS
jgi:predicted transport protein